MIYIVIITVVTAILAVSYMYDSRAVTVITGRSRLTPFLIVPYAVMEAVLCGVPCLIWQVWS